MTKTIERETDFLYKITTKTDKKLLLHIEFQSKNDSKMLLRMAEYHGLIFKKFQLPIQHIVVYLGKAKANMPNFLKEDEIFTGFELISINELAAEQFLSSQVPELILLAFLSKYEKSETETILKTVIEQLKIKSSSENELKKYVSQLMLLTRLRKLDDLTVKILEDMPLTIDIEKDILYKKGIEKGIDIGVEKGIDIGVEKGIDIGVGKGIQMGVIALEKDGFSIEKIASVFEISIEKVKTILKIEA